MRTEELINKFCDLTSSPVPLYREDKETILKRMFSIGYLSDEEYIARKESLSKTDKNILIR